MSVEIVTPFEHCFPQVSTWPNRQRGEHCLRDITLIDDLIIEAPISEPACYNHEVAIKSASIKDDKSKSLILVDVIVEYSDLENEEDKIRKEEIPIQLWR